jgi:purine-binding chemotaxis protein CheW
VSEAKQFCTFYIEERLYGIAVEQVQEVLREQAMTRVPLAPEAVRGLINLRGKIVTAVDLRKRLGLGAKRTPGAPMNVVLSSEEDTVSLLVDAIGDVVSVESETFEGLPQTLRGEVREFVTGVYKLAGGLLHVLDAQRSATLEQIRGQGREV